MMKEVELIKQFTLLTFKFKVPCLLLGHYLLHKRLIDSTIYY